MKLNFSPRAKRYYRLSLVLSILSGVVLGLILCGAIDELRSSIMLWFLVPIFIGLILGALTLGFYLIFLNQKRP